MYVVFVVQRFLCAHISCFTAITFFNVEIDMPLSVDVPLYFDFLSLAVLVFVVYKFVLP